MRRRSPTDDDDIIATFLGPSGPTFIAACEARDKYLDAQKDFLGPSGPTFIAAEDLGHNWLSADLAFLGLSGPTFIAASNTRWGQ